MGKARQLYQEFLNSLEPEAVSRVRAAITELTLVFEHFGLADGLLDQDEKLRLADIIEQGETIQAGRKTANTVLHRAVVTILRMEDEE